MSKRDAGARSGIRFRNSDLAPPAFTSRQVSFHHILVQFDADSGLVAHRNEAALDIRLIEQEQLVGPATLSGHRFAGDVIADGGCPLASGIREYLAPRVMSGHGEAKN